MISGTNDTRYAFVNGVIRAKEAKFLKKTHFERLIEADVDSFRLILSDTAYAGSGEFLNILSDIEKEEAAFFDKYCLHQEIKEMVFLPLKIHNLKVKLKNGGANLLYNIDVKELEEKKEILKIISDYLQHRNSFILSTELDKFLCKRIFELSKVSPFFFEYAQLYFDIENIRSFFRARTFENPFEIFKQVFIKYGTIPEKLFLDCLDKEPSAIFKALRNTIYAGLVEQGGAYLETHGSFLRLERISDEMRLNFLKKARYFTFGVEPLFSYYHFKTAEIKKLRQVYMGRQYNIPLAQLKESIPDVW
jgi:V/A-type H+-transporting ATPase subunit C|uniref:V-type ATP synthase subunit C n=1 Tax=candidate division WOR-3 bacterium TaxID=2052148 RepID=A0A7V3RI98_UNCW3